MSNPYPPTPSFAGAYPGYPFTTAALRDAGFQPLSGGPPVANQSFGYPASTPPSNPTPAVNAQNFHANAAISHSGHPVPPHVPPPPFHVSPAFLKQFANSSIPPPPYPPVPIPHIGFPQFPPPPPNFAATSTPFNNFVTSDTPSHPPIQPHIPSPQAIPEYLQPSYIASREEGELSDGELDESSPASTAGNSRPVQKDHTDPPLMPQVGACSNQLGQSIGMLSALC
jgi:hypothetical protein